MAGKSYKRVICQVAEEAQLLAERKWIIDALKQIKRQRNSLQIERLNLENLKEKLKSGDEQRTENRTVAPSPSPVQSALNMMQHIPTSNTHIEFELPTSGLDDTCNTEELNLAVTDPVFNNADPGSYEIEEDDEDMEDCDIDMDMFMCGNIVGPRTRADRTDLDDE